MLKKIFRLSQRFFEEFKPVTGQGYKSKTRQLIEVMQLILRCQLTPFEYKYFKFYALDKDYKDMLNYLSTFHSLNYHDALGDPEWVPVLRNKLLFNLYYSKFKLPVTTVYGYFEEQTGFTMEGAPLTNGEELKSLLLRIKPPSLVIKPVGGGRGKNILVLEGLDFTRNELLCRANGGRELTFSELFAHVQQTTPGSPYSGYLLEGKLAQHEAIHNISPYALNTVRLVTFLNKEHQVDLLFSILRLGLAGSSVDNISQGGLAVYVNTVDGVLGEGIFYPDPSGSVYSEHPDTKFTFSGLKVPFWGELVQLCTAAAKLTPFCRSIGWDVAITPHGPVLVEGNDSWGINIHQGFGKGFLQPEVREGLAPFGLIFPENRLPGINIRVLRQALKKWGR